MTTTVLSALLCFYSVTQVNLNLPIHFGYIPHACHSHVSCSIVIIMYTAECADREIRLVGGIDTDREGRVEVCVVSPLNLWRTVCTGSQELAGAVCSQMGYILEGNGVD